MEASKRVLCQSLLLSTTVLNDVRLLLPYVVTILVRPQVSQLLYSGISLRVFNFVIWDALIKVSTQFLSIRIAIFYCIRQNSLEGKLSRLLLNRESFLIEYFTRLGIHYYKLLL